jgi:uncharacterized protein involved in exopolysaccharide biosynthesis
MDSETDKKDPDDKISLIDLFAVLWQRKKMIITVTLTAAVGVILYSVISLALPPEKSYMPNIYTSEALMLIDNKSSSAGGLSSMLSSMGGLSSLFGGVATSATSSELAIFLVGSNSFLDSVVDNFNLIEKYKIKVNPRTSSRNIFKDSLKAEYTGASGILSISYTHTDPVFARDVVNFSSAYLGQRFDELGLDKNKIEKENLEINIANTYQAITKLEEESRKLDQSVTSGLSYGGLPAITMDINRIALELNAQRQVYTQLVVQYELLKVTMASETPVFQILEMAEIPELKSGPSRGMICIIVTLAAGFLSVFLAFALNAISYIKNDPQIMAKLRRINEK